MKKLSIFLSTIIGVAGLSSFYLLTRSKTEAPALDINSVSVHDPSILKTNDSYFIFGSHLAAARSNDLINWDYLSKNVDTTTLFRHVKEEFQPEFNYAKTNTFWAPDVIQLADGKYYMYYCLCEGSSPLSVLGVARSDKIEGPYTKIKSFLYAGTSPQFNETYNANTMPNTVDPNVFYDKENRLWMVYGSYSGGIFILELNPDTGLPLDETSYGKHLMGGNHARIEAPYIVYDQTADYYYLFTSFGGLDADGGYNIRVSRSKHPNGPYQDISGNNMEEAKGKYGTVFDDEAIKQYGNKLIGNFIFSKDDPFSTEGYLSPGHNSVYIDQNKNEKYLVFHTRFPNQGEEHSVRIHQYYLTETNWPILTPFPYNKETIKNYSKQEVSGHYALFEFSKEISDEAALPKKVKLNISNTISGTATGHWQLAKDNTKHDSFIELNNVRYTGKFILCTNPYTNKETMCFTGISETGEPLFLINETE